MITTELEEAVRVGEERRESMESACDSILLGANEFVSKYGCY
jgi:hypothetical protein